MKQTINTPNRVMVISLFSMGYGVFWAVLINNRIINLVFGITTLLIALIFYFKQEKEGKR